MIKRISLLLTAALMAAMMTVATAAPAFAAPPAEEACLAQNDADTVATYDRIGPGVYTCTVTDKSLEPVSPSNGTENDHRAKPHTETVVTTDTETQKGQGGGAATGNPNNTDPPPVDSPPTCTNGGGNPVKC